MSQKWFFDSSDSRTYLEAGFRIPEQRRDSAGKFAEKRQDLPGERVKWAKSAAHKQGAAMRKVDAEISSDGMISIPEDIQEIYAADKGSLMVKVLAFMSHEEFTVPTRYISAGGMYDFDRVQAQRSTGEYVYSIPVHNLVRTDNPDGEQNARRQAFFFLVRMKADGEETEVFIDRVTITRGSRHYRIRVNNQFHRRGTMRRILDLVSAQEHLQDIPLYEVFKRFGMWRSEHR